MFTFGVFTSSTEDSRYFFSHESASARTYIECKRSKNNNNKRREHTTNKSVEKERGFHPSF